MRYLNWYGGVPSAEITLVSVFGNGRRTDAITWAIWRSMPGSSTRRFTQMPAVSRP